MALDNPPLTVGTGEERPEHWNRVIMIAWRNSSGVRYENGPLAPDRRRAGAIAAALNAAAHRLNPEGEYPMLRDFPHVAWLEPARIGPGGEPMDDRTLTFGPYGGEPFRIDMDATLAASPERRLALAWILRDMSDKIMKETH